MVRFLGEVGFQESRLFGGDSQNLVIKMTMIIYLNQFFCILITYKYYFQNTTIFIFVLIFFLKTYSLTMGSIIIFQTVISLKIIHSFSSKLQKAKTFKMRISIILLVVSSNKIIKICYSILELI